MKIKPGTYVGSLCTLFVLMIGIKIGERETKFKFGLSTRQRGDGDERS